MSSDLRERLGQMTTDELLEIVTRHDADEWRAEVFPLAEGILRERGVDASAMTKPAESPISQESPQLVEVMAVQNPAVLPIVKSLLEEGEFTFVIKNELTQGLFAWGQFGTGYNLITGPPTVLVEASRAEEARQLLEPVVHKSASDPTSDDDAPADEQ